MKKISRPQSRLYGVSIVMLFCMIVLSSTSAKANMPPADAVSVGSSVCLDCHEDVGNDFAKTMHGTLLSKASESSCESCHGPGSAHAENQDPAMIINPAKQDQFDGKSTCLNCHNTDNFSNWIMADHNAANMNCSSCHSVHSEYEAKTTGKINNLCTECHLDVKAASFMPSHHPLKEGNMSCIDCHDPHGGQATFAHDGSNRELCFSCHPEKEGPFIFEHAPVNEDCMLCHSPHGTVADNLLTQTEPALCLNCHAMHFHAAIEGWDGNFANPQAPDRAGTSTPDSWKEGMLTKCTQCHTEIHGSDMPSQAISTSGTGLTR